MFSGEIPKFALVPALARALGDHSPGARARRQSHGPRHVRLEGKAYRVLKIWDAIAKPTNESKEKDIQKESAPSVDN